MRINFIQISNIMSFKFVPDIAHAEKIKFDSGLNIVIGENGAGKSTLLEIINFLFRHVICRSVVFNHQYYNGLHRDQPRNTLQQLPLNLKSFRLNPNFANESDEQHIRISLQLDDIDKKNITHITQNFQKITKVINAYSTDPNKLANNPELNKNSTDEYTFDLLLQYPKELVLNPINPRHNPSNPPSVSLSRGEEDLGYFYLTDYNLFKEAISIHNYSHRNDQITPLLEPFTLISSYRNYREFNSSTSLASSTAAQQIKANQSKEFSQSVNASDGNEPAIFEQVRLQLAERHFDLVDVPITPEQRLDGANTMPIVASINKRLEIINLRCQLELIDMRTWKYSVDFYDTLRGRKLGDINGLSSGQKAIIHLVFEAYGRGELGGGVVIIDEPELHLHYQFQHEYLKLIRELNEQQKCQYILVTHSDALINSDTIKSVRRFALRADGSTVVHSPELGDSQKNLIQILDNMRSTYAFFAKKVVLCEGETDRYFIRAILQKYHPKLDQEIAVLTVGGKKNIPKWRELFKSFGLTVFAIADFDYLPDLHYPSLAQDKKAPDSCEKIADFKNKYPDWEEKIDVESQKQTFILKDGDLECYLSISKSNKGLDAIITFCDDQLETFWTNPSCNKSKEWQNIINEIVK